MGTIDQGAVRELERLQVAFEATGDGMWDWNLDSGAVWFSTRSRELLGGATDDGRCVEKADVRARLHPDDVPRLQAAFAEAVQGSADRCSSEVRVRHLGGHWVWMLMRGGVLDRSPDGRARRIVGTMKDITERKQLEIQNELLLTLSDALLREDSPDGMLREALQLLGRHFELSRCCIADVDMTSGTLSIRHSWTDGSVPSGIGTHLMADFEGGRREAILNGLTGVYPDIETNPATNDPRTLAAFAPFEVRAILSLPMVRLGQLEAVLMLHDRSPRNWTASEVQLAEMARTRIWDAVIRERAETRLRESESRFASIFELTPTIPWVVDPDGAPLMMGATYTEKTGLRPEDVANDGWAQTVHPDDREEALRTIVGCRKTGEPMDVRYRMRQADGSYRWVRVQGAPRRDSAGRITQWVGYIADIHEQVEVELALRKSEAEARATALLLDQVLETTPDAIWAMDLENRYLMANSATSRIVGAAREDIVGRPVWEFLPREFQQQTRGQTDTIRAGSEVHVEEPLFHKDLGEVRIFESRKVPLMGADGELLGVVGISRDITERKQAEQALQASEAAARDSALLLERILETTPALVWVMDRDGRYLLLNGAAARVIGIERESAVGRPVEEVLPPKFAAQVRAELARVLEGAEIVVEELLDDHERGEMRIFDSLKVPLRGTDGAITGLVGVSRDITERKAVELRLQAIVDTAVDAIVVIDEEGCIASANPSTFTLFGYTEQEMVGRNVAMLMPPGDSAAHDRYIDNYRRTGERRIIGIGRQVMGLRKDGSSFPLDLSIAEWSDTNGKRHFTGIMRDVSARLDAEARLRRANDTLISVSRLSAAGAMASTLAHELNQPLTASSNLLRSARRLLERGDQGEKVPGLLGEASTEVLRAGAIIRRMREYTVNGELEPAPYRFADLITNALQMVQRRPEAKGVQVNWLLDPEVDAVMADQIQIEQVIVNLLRNAVEAMRGGAVRRIEIETEAEGDQAALHVRDTGPGISAEQMERLFQPFATTKDSGTGLGLAICRTIVEAHGGRIFARNRADGPGAVFTMTLPVAPARKAASVEAGA